MTSCFHCQEPVPSGSEITADVSGTANPVCCLGCKAAAELISDAGLADFYRFRTAAAPRPQDSGEDVWSTYDRPDVAAPLLGREGDHSVVNVLIEDTRCSACSWLIGEQLRRLPGVARAAMNPATARAQVVFDGERIGLAHILRSVASLGYRPHVLGATDTLEVATRERRTALKRLAVAGFGMMQVMMIATGLYVGARQGIDPIIREYLRMTCLVVTGPVLVYAGKPFFVGAWAALRSRHLGMDVPVAIALVLAFLASAWNTLAHRGEVYFDSVTMFIFLLLLARYIEMSARHRAVSTGDALLRLVPATALRIRSGLRERVPVSALTEGDRIVVPVGECFPADGSIVVGRTEVDEAMLTGESRPVSKTEGMAVIAGSLNVGGPVEIALSAVGAGTILAGIVRLLERAQTERPRIARLADRAATWFVTRVLLGALIVALLWLWIDPTRAFESTLSVLVVTCPCALSLATPTVVTATTATLARQGLLVTRADAIEALAQVDHVVFDKTGTLTEGKPRIEKVWVLRGHSEDALRIAAGLEQASEHPLAHAFAHIQTDQRAQGVVVFPGEGLEGVLQGTLWRIGTKPFVAAIAGPPPADCVDASIYLGDGSGWHAAFQLEDSVRTDAAATVRALQQLTLTCHMASGDHTEAVALTAGRLGISDWRARQMPDEKVAFVRSLSVQGHRVLAVGDGINDAPVLAAASVSAALGTGSALAQATADVVVLRGDLATLPTAIATARRATRIIRQNLAWATLYNLVALPIAALGWIPPWLAAIGMSTSSLVVVLNALRLTRPIRPNRTAAVPTVVCRA
jgi:P-type Cu2+ transporter